MSESFGVIKVGEKLPVFGDAYMGSEGAVFDTLGQGAGYILAVYLRNFSFQEKLLMESRKIEIRGIFDGPFCLLLFRLKGTPMIFECAFSPTKRDESDVLQFYLDNHMLTYVGVESTNNIVRTLGMGNLPRAFKHKCGITWGKALDMGEKHHDQFVKWYNDLDARYTIIQLWNRADKLGYVGEE